jgi:hypothetical protein
VRDVLIALAVVRSALDVADARERREAVAQRVALELGVQQLRELANARLAIRVADVEDLAVAASAFVLDDPEEAVDSFGHVGKATLLGAAVHHLHRRAFDEVRDQLRDRARATDARGFQSVEPRADPVEGPE